MIFCPATLQLDGTPWMIYGGWLAGNSTGSNVFTGPGQLGYFQNVKGLLQTKQI